MPIERKTLPGPAPGAGSCWLSRLERALEGCFAESNRDNHREESKTTYKRFESIKFLVLYVSYMFVLSHVSVIDEGLSMNIRLHSGILVFIFAAMFQHFNLHNHNQMRTEHNTLKASMLLRPFATCQERAVYTYIYM